jgi:alcohol dehydrogenase class IV
MSDLTTKASALLKEFKGDSYAFGSGVLDKAPGKFAAEFGNNAMFVGPIEEEWFQTTKDRILKSLDKAGVNVVDVVRSAAPNAPFVDVYRIHSHIMHKKPDVLVVGDGGSGIDATKAAATLASLGDIQPEIDPFFGVGQVTKVCQESGRTIMPVIAIMMAASSGAHLTKYSNITDPVVGQKKLIVDEAIIPPRCVFDYDVTTSQPMSLTLDGGFDGIAHCLEVYFGAVPEIENQARQVAELGIEALIKGLTEVKKDPGDYGIGRRFGRLRHHDRRHFRSASQQLLPGGCAYPWPCLCADEPLLHGIFCSGYRKEITDNRGHL